MTIGGPSDFAEALQARARKTTVPSSMSSAEWRAMAPGIRERAFWAARVENSNILDEFGKLIDSILRPQAGERVNPETGTPITEGLNIASARMEAKDFLRRIDYRPSEGDEGSIKDLRTSERINLILRTNVETAQGYGQFVQGQNEEVLVAWPAQELFRAESRNEERDWAARWKFAAETSGDGNALRVALDTGRFVALKDSPIWEALGNTDDDSLGNPYPPFAFRSGMWVRDVSRTEAVELGLCDPGTQVTPQDRGFNDALEMSTGDMDAQLRAALMVDLGEGYTMGADGVIHRK